MSLAGHNVTAQVGNLSVSTYAGAGSASTVPGGVSFDTGIFNVANLSIANNSGGASIVGPNGSVTIGTSAASTGVFSVSNSFLLANNTNTGATATANGNFTLNGGTVNTSVNIGRVGKSNTTFTMNAGTLNLNGHSIGTPSAPLTTINLAAGNVTNASTIAGANITLGSALTITGNLNFVLDGNVAGTLNSASPVTFAAGTGISGSNGTASIIGSFAFGTGSVVAPGNATVTSNLSFASDLTMNNGSIANMKLGPSSNDIISTAGTLTLNGIISLNLSAAGAGPVSGSTVPLFNFATLVGSTANLSLGAQTTRYVFTLGTTPTSITVTAGGTGPLAITYTGSVNSNWDLITTPNFQDATPAPQKFFSLDNVTFSDTSTNLNDVQLVGSLNPGSIEVNATRNYTFSGTGAITGVTAITKDNSGTLIVATNNTYSGGTTINSGTVQVGNGGTAGSLGSGSVTLVAGNLNLNRSDAFTFPNVIVGSGTVSVSGTGTVTLTGANTYFGPTNLNAGTTKIINAASLGATNGNIVTIASGATLDLGGDITVNDGALNFQGKQFVVSGTGVGGVGAITNTGVSQQNAFNNIQLAGDTTFSGFRFDIGRTGTGSLDLAGHTLTVNMNAAASSLFAILTGTTVTPGQIIVNTGGISIERNAIITNDGTSTITYMPNTEAFFFAPNPVNITRQMIFKGGNIIGAGDATATSAINNPMTLNGSVTLEPMSNGVPAPASSFPLALQNNITEVGGSFAVNKLGVNTNVLSGANSTWSGAGTLAAGVLEFAPNATTGTNTSSIGSYTGNGTLTVDAGVVISSGGLQFSDLYVYGSLKIRNSATPYVC